MSQGPNFQPARPCGWVIWALQQLIRLDLALHNRLRLEARDLEVLRKIPQGTGIILTPNHADETDFRVCLDLSRRSRRRFLFMANREAFAEGFGTAGWGLQLIGAFSVERGGDNAAAKRYAIETVKRGGEVLVIFPEGEIYYLNDLVQPFKSGAVDIGMQAVVEARQTRPDWTVYLVPLAIKYRYHRPIRPILEERIRRMEERLSQRVGLHGFQGRLRLIMAELLHRQELAHHLQPGSDRLTELSERVQQVRQAVLSQVEETYAGAVAAPQVRTMDRAWQLSSYLRNRLTNRRRSTGEGRAQFRRDLALLRRVAEMGSWQPQYVDLDPSQERLAEMVLKLEREVYQLKRPRQLAKRDVFLRIGAPVDLGRSIPDYLQDPHTVRHRIAEQLRDTIQSLIDTTISPQSGQV